MRAILAALLAALPAMASAQVLTDHSDEVLFRALATCPEAQAAYREANAQDAAGPFYRAAKITARCAERSHGLTAGALWVEAVTALVSDVMGRNPSPDLSRAAATLARSYVKRGYPLLKNQSDLTATLHKYEDELP